MTVCLDISKLEKARHTGGKTIARCPACAEAGKDKSGEHLMIAANGKFGCVDNPGPQGVAHRKRIFELVGSVIPDTPRPAHRQAAARPVKTFTSAEEAARQCTPKDGTLEAVYPYPRKGQPFGATARYRTQDDKTFRQFHATPTGWTTGAPAGKWPLYSETELPDTGDIDVFEGEKCADSAANIGLAATCSAGGAKAAGKTDWAMLAGRNVRLWPDSDDAGAVYVSEVAEKLNHLSPPANVKIVCLPGLPEGGDLVDFCEARDAAEPETIRAELLRLAEAAPVWTAAEIKTANVSKLGTERDPLDAAKDGQPLARTDTGLAERFAFYHGGEVAYQTESGAWFVWDGKRWARDPGLVEVRRRLAETARQIKAECSVLPESMGAQNRMDYFRFALSCEQVGRMDAAARLAPSLGLARSLVMFDADPMRLCVKNGTLDLRTGKLHPHKREEFITRFSPVEFIPDATDPTFRQFIDHATNGDEELEAYLQRATGYTLTGHIGEKCLFIIYSLATDTGKTCFITALLTALGEYGMTISFDSILEPDRGGQPNYDLAKLCGARLAVASETKPGRRFAAELIKQLTGGDTLRAREIRQSSVEFRPTHKLWLSTNHAPMLSDGGDEATWNRLRRVPFSNQIPKAERNPQILAALSDPTSAAARAFLAWAVRGAVLWNEQGLKTCAAVDESTAAYQSETDPLLDFIEDYCELDQNASTTAADLRRAYEGWAAKNGQRFTLSRHRFAAVLRKHECQEHKGAGGVRSWLGIGLTVVLSD